LRRSALALVAAAILPALAASAEVPSNAEIRKILAERLGREDLGVGIVVGVIDANGRRVVSYGQLAKDDKRPLDGDTVFEIGSITKVFTSLLLMDMTRRGEVSPSDPVSKYLPAGVKVAERNGRKITLADLATHTSGLPRMPTNFAPKDPENPFADYSVQQLYDFLSSYHLTRDVGSQFEYSNVGVGLLGHALSLRAGTSYETLVRSRICEPLGMPDTRITLTPGMKERLATGHNGALVAVSSWDIPTLPGAGALRSTANDMLIFLAANLGYFTTPLAGAMADQVSARWGVVTGYGWGPARTQSGKQVVAHTGGTGGYQSYAGFDPQARVGVVVLSNLSNEGVDDIGRHLLDPGIPLVKLAPPVEHKQVAFDPKVFDRYVGTYRVGRHMLAAVSREGNRFYVDLTGSPRFEMFPESERKFFLKVSDTQLTFDARGTEVSLHDEGRDSAGKRLSESEAKTVKAAIDARDAAIAKRFQEQTQSPGTEAALRHAIDGLLKGTPDYTSMIPQLADSVRQQQPRLKANFAQLGALKSVTFKGVGPAGADIYEVKFEHGKTVWRIILGSDGKVEFLNFHPL
jgi:CubicO group peptidase (beta-lactamase class C family)